MSARPGLERHLAAPRLEADGHPINGQGRGWEAFR